MHWPVDPRSLRSRKAPIPVRARVVWERDGEQYVDVELIDKRVQGSRQRGPCTNECETWPTSTTSIRAQA
jgi:hypothetical protein